MNEKIYYEILFLFLEENNKKINDAWSLDEHLNTFTNKELSKAAVIDFLQGKDVSYVLNVRDFTNQKKSYNVDYVKEHLVSIINTYVKILPHDIVKQLRKLMNSNGSISYHISEKGIFNLNFLKFLKNSIIARVYLDKEEKMIHIFMPDFIVKILKDAFNNKEIIKCNKKYNRIYKLTSDCVDTYGILTMEELHLLLDKFHIGISYDELMLIISDYLLIDDRFGLYLYEKTILVCNVEFSEMEDAINFYEKLEGDLNLKLSLKEIEKIGNDEYIHHLKSYKKLVNWLNDLFEGIKEDSEYLDCFIISDYIFSAQTSLEIAEKNFRNNIQETLELDPIETNIMANMLKDIYNEYPKWRKRGNI